MQVYLRDGAYRDAEGRLHKVCRNWTEAKKRGLPAPCPNHGEDEVWACHGFGWSTHTPLRLVPDGIVSLCRHCDPDRNPAMRPGWWGSPKRPVKAGWERRQGPPSGGFWHKVGVLVLSVPLWWAIVIADVDLRYYWAWSRHFTFGQATTIGGMFTLLLGLVALWGACLILCHLALRRRWLGRGSRAVLRALGRLAKWAKP